MANDDIDLLADELDGFQPEARKDIHSIRQERIIAGFEDIQRFFEREGRLPQAGPDADIFERIYNVRLDRLRSLEDCRTILAALDHQGLLGPAENMKAANGFDPDDDQLAVALGGDLPEQGIRALRHVPSNAERQEAEEIAHRKKCADFAKFRPMFQKVEAELKTGIRSTRPFVRDTGFQKSDIKAGQFFILGGHMVHVAEVGEPIRAPNGHLDARLRLIYSNGTESDLLLRSLQRALYKDDGGRRITEPQAGPLFAEDPTEEDESSGTIYVLRSKSQLPLVVQHRELIHKIGVTGGSVERRIGNARLDPTFLMADVEIVATYTLFNVHRGKLEALLHRLFEPAKLNIEVMDRLGNPIAPHEWFVVPLAVIDKAVEHIKNGTISVLVYDPACSDLVAAK